MESAAKHANTCSILDIERFDNVWFEDGNIIVVVEKKGFRVHKAVLALHSTVFAENFAVASLTICPNNKCHHGTAQDDIDGVPAIYLQDDSAEDVFYFLKVLYDWTHRTNLITFDVLSGLLRFSTKYMSRQIRRAMIDEMLSGYPTAFGYGKLSVKAGRFEDQEFAYFKLAREANVHSVLPELYYALTKHPLEKIKEKVGDIDASSVWRLVVGREKLHAIEMQKILSEVPQSEIKDHEGGGQCQSIVLSRLEQCKTCIPSFRVDFIYLSAGICRNCYTKLFGVLHECNRHIHSQLPKLFELDDYDTLIRLDEESTVL